ncbi:RNA-binding protein [Kozakia baliensis]|nr:RNA-binding protein [Kozakia baliensis]GBR28049.1 hypothetical protein AA0488_1303 [Kozakia baliensis NRIC 0488]GEL63796.1 hypothetical protein KBA01_10820 [Kozakia baliensis]
MYDERESGSLRRCIVTRVQDSPERMLRFVVSPDGMIIPDLAGKLPGRGIWLSAKRDVLETAVTRNVFAKAARRSVQLPDDLVLILVEALKRRVADSLGLARRAGQAICGFVKCREWIAAGKAGLVVQGAGGSPDELRRLLSGARELPVATLSSEMLATAFGREHAVYAVLAPGALALRLMAEHERFLGLTEGSVPGPRAVRSGREQAGI